jgi:hypothetical protein
MSSRFITNVVALVASAIVVISSQTFAGGTLKWIAFGIALGVLGMTAVAQASRSRGRAQRVVDAIVGLVAIWSAVASMVFDRSALTWLTFGDAVALFTVAIAGLAAHELSTERVVHHLAAGEPAVKASEPYPVAA